MLLVEKVEEPGEVRKAVERGLRAVAGGQSALLDIRLKTVSPSSSAAKDSSLQNCPDQRRPGIVCGYSAGVVIFDDGKLAAKSY